MTIELCPDGHGACSVLSAAAHGGDVAAPALICELTPSPSAGCSGIVDRLRIGIFGADTHPVTRPQTAGLAKASTRVQHLDHEASPLPSPGDLGSWAGLIRPGTRGLVPVALHGQLVVGHPIDDPVPGGSVHSAAGCCSLLVLVMATLPNRREAPRWWAVISCEMPLVPSCRRKAFDGELAGGEDGVALRVVRSPSMAMCVGEAEAPDRAGSPGEIYRRGLRGWLPHTLSSSCERSITAVAGSGLSRVTA